MIFYDLMEIYAGFYEAVIEMTIKTVLINEKRKGMSHEKKSFHY